MDDNDFMIMKTTTNSYRQFVHSSTDAAVALGAAVAQSSSPIEELHGVIRNFHEQVVPTFSLDTFHSHFRMTRSAMEVFFCY